MNAHRLVEITPATHRVDIDLVYATDRNLTGKPIYRRAHCLLLAPAEAALRRAVNIAAQAGFTLRIYDAYRRRRRSRCCGISCPIRTSSPISVAARITAAAPRST